MMSAPGREGQSISRGTFESNPKGYFDQLHADQKGSK
ncbi:hypothetical protein AMTRI_Chr10g229210 [Amborella trichopoda]